MTRHTKVPLTFAIYVLVAVCLANGWLFAAAGCTPRRGRGALRLHGSHLSRHQRGPWVPAQRAERLAAPGAAGHVRGAVRAADVRPDAPASQAGVAALRVRAVARGRRHGEPAQRRGDVPVHQPRDVGRVPRARSPRCRARRPHSSRTSSRTGCGGPSSSSRGTATRASGRCASSASGAGTGTRPSRPRLGPRRSGQGSSRHPRTSRQGMSAQTRVLRPPSTASDLAGDVAPPRLTRGTPTAQRRPPMRCPSAQAAQVSCHGSAAPRTPTDRVGCR